MDNIIELGIPEGLTRLDISCNSIIDALPRTLKSIVVIGVDENNEYYDATSHGKLADSLLDIEVFKRKLIDMASGEEYD